MIVVIVTLASTLAFQIGFFLWKLSADELPPMGATPFLKVVPALFANWKWALGFVLTLVGWLLYVKATDLGEVSVVQPLMSVGGPFLVLLSVLFLRERLNRNEWGGLGLTIAGAALLSFEASVIQHVEIVWPRLLVLGGLATAGSFAFILVSRKKPRSELPLAWAVGLVFGIGAILTKLMTATLTLQGRTLESTAFVLNPILPFMVAANVAGMVGLQFAFQRGRASVVIPVQIAVTNALAVLAGLIGFAETMGFVQVAGIGLIVTGAAWLQFAQNKESGTH